jgi:hypothetical protein
VKKLVLALAAVALAGCNPLTDSNSFSFHFSVQPLDQAPATPAPATLIKDAVGLVRISGDASTPCSDQGVRLTGSRSGSELRVSIERQSGAACSGGVQWFSYDALMTLPVSSTYHLLMTDNTSGSSVVVLDEQVVVTG